MVLRGNASWLISPELMRVTASLPCSRSPAIPQIPSGVCNLGYLQHGVMARLHSERLNGYLISQIKFLGFTDVCSLANQKHHITWELVQECKFSAPHQTHESEILRKRFSNLCTITSPPRDSPRDTHKSVRTPEHSRATKSHKMFALKTTYGWMLGNRSLNTRNPLCTQLASTPKLFYLIAPLCKKRSIL